MNKVERVWGASFFLSYETATGAASFQAAVVFEV